MLTLSARSLVRWLLGIAAALVVLHLITAYVVRVTGHDHVFGFAGMFNLDAEQNATTWFASMLHLGAAVMLLIAGIQARATPMARRRFWFVLAAIFAFFSFDEFVSFHENGIGLMRHMRQFSDLFYFAWVIPGAAFVGAVGLASIGFLRALPRETAVAFVVSGALFVAGALGMEMIGGSYAADAVREGDAQYRTDVAYTLFIMLEEGLEMLGVILFIGATVRHVASGPAVSVDFARGPSGAGAAWGRPARSPARRSAPGGMPRPAIEPMHAGGRGTDVPVASPPPVREGGGFRS